MKCYDIKPIGKPRIVHSSKFSKAAKRFYAFRDQICVAGIHIPASGAHITFGIPMPKSWSKKKKMQMVGKPHQNKPDIDNLLKALLDSASGKDDKYIFNIAATKVWTYRGIICIETGLSLPNFLKNQPFNL